MKLYFAPLEGIGGYIYRNTYARHFGNIDKYYSPFIAAGPEVHFHKREIRDVMPENNSGVPLIPQILTNHAGAFLETAKVLHEFGYEEVNLNLGCPSRTVVAKGKGAGFLANLERLNKFLDEVFQNINMQVSVKTRIGIESSDEWGALLEIFNRYPLTEIIVHPRIQKQHYNGQPDWEKFQEALEQSRHPVCYNGNIFTVSDYQKFIETFPKVDRIMLGRGILANPGLTGEILGKTGIEKKKLREFHDELLQEYKRVLNDEKNTLFKMKELWHYLSFLFEDSKKEAKKIRKAEKLPAYLEAVDRMFAQHELQREVGFEWNP